jgi:hypothetical protein
MLFLAMPASEAFVKRLVLAAQALFGESNEDEFRHPKQDETGKGGKKGPAT